MNNNWAIAATYEGDAQTFAGTPCWYIKPATVLHRVLIGVQTRKGRWVEKWVHEDTLTEFRVEELPEPDNAEHARAMPFDRYPSRGDAEVVVNELVGSRW